MSHATAASSHRPTSTEPSYIYLATAAPATSAAASHVNRFPALDTLREDGGASPCPSGDVIPSPRRGGDEIPPPGACVRPDDDHDHGIGRSAAYDDYNDVGVNHRARDNNRQALSSSRVDSLVTHERNDRHRHDQEEEQEEEEQEEEEEGSMARYEVVDAADLLITQPILFRPLHTYLTQ